MVRLFHVYYPVRTVVLLTCEALLTGASFLIATFLVLGTNSYFVLSQDHGSQKILGITIVTLLCSYYFDLYAPQSLPSKSEIYFRLFVVLGVVSFLIAAVGYLYPRFMFGRYVFLIGLTI